MLDLFTADIIVEQLKPREGDRRAAFIPFISTILLIKKLIKNSMSNICILGYRVTNGLQKTVSPKIRHIGHIRSENHSPTCRICHICHLICIHTGTCLHTHIKAICPDWENILGLAVFAACDLIFEAFAVWNIEVCFNFSIAVWTVEC
jgi:hypothetical protein